MNRLARLLKLLTHLVVFYNLAIILMLGWPTTGFIGLVVGFAMIGKRGAGYVSTLLGSARWANARDLKRAGMLKGSSGLIIGRLQ